MRKKRKRDTRGGSLAAFLRRLPSKAVEDNGTVTAKTSDDESIKSRVVAKGEAESVQSKVTETENFNRSVVFERIGWSEVKEKGCFFKGVCFSPDGSMLLACNEDKTFRSIKPSSESNDQKLLSKVVAKEHETVYDYCFYPSFKQGDPISCCFLSVTKDNPVH